MSDQGKAPRCPVCLAEASEVVEEMAVTRVKRGAIVPVDSMVTNRWWECPRGHGRLIDITSVDDTERRYAVSGPVDVADVAHLGDPP